MQIEIKDIDQCVKEMTVTVPKDAANQDYAKVMHDFKKYAMVPGYRKGKAPLSMVNNMYGNKIKESYITEKVEDYFKEALEEKDIQSIITTELLDVKWEPGEDFVAILRYEVPPQVEINKFTGLKIPFKPAVFEEIMVDESIERLKDSSAEYEAGSEVTKDAVVAFSGKFLAPDEQEEVLPEELTYLRMKSHNFGDELDKAVLGAKVEDVIETKVKLNDEELHPVELKVVEINIVNYPEIDDEFAEKGGHGSLKELRQSIKENIEKNIETSNKNNKIKAVNFALMKENPFDIPPSALVEFTKKMVEPYANYFNKPTQDLINDYLPKAVYDMKSYYISDDLLEQLSFEITEEDQQKMIEISAKELNLSNEEYLQRNPDVTKQPEFVEMIKKDKLYEYLFENNEFVEKEENTDVKEAVISDNKDDVTKGN